MDPFIIVLLVSFGSTTGPYIVFYAQYATGQPGESCCWKCLQNHCYATRNRIHPREL